MRTYHITSIVSGLFIGAFEAETEAEALDAMARDAGYRSYEHAAQTLVQSVESARSELLVVER